MVTVRSVSTVLSNATSASLKVDRDTQRGGPSVARLRNGWKRKKPALAIHPTTSRSKGFGRFRSASPAASSLDE